MNEAINTNEATTLTPAEETKPLVTAEEHEQGWKDVEVEFRSERKATWRLKAPPGRAAREAFVECLAGKDAWGVVGMALPEGVTVEELDRLKLDSLNRVSECAHIMAFGEADYKKMSGAIALLARTVAKAVSDPATRADADADAGELDKLDARHAAAVAAVPMPSVPPNEGSQS